MKEKLLGCSEMEKFDDETISEIYSQIDDLFTGIKHIKKILINDRTNYVYKECFYRINFVNGLGFIIEYAGSFQEAIRNLYEDGDIFPLSLGKNLVKTMKEDMIKCYNFGIDMQP